MKCLVIGGGFGGLCSITGLRKDDKAVEIILVEPKSYFEVVWGAYRTPFDETKALEGVRDLTTYCEEKNVQHIKSVVTKLTETQAELANGSTVEFDVCVVATGASIKWPACGRVPPEEAKETREARLEAMKAEGEKLVNAESVLIVGGGLIGSELAGDVAYFKKQQDKEVNVTLVQSGPQLCPEMKPNAAAMVQRKLEKLGVKVILNERVVTKDDATMTLESSGEKIEATEVVMTVGLSPLNGFMDSSLLNEKGWVTVDDFFRVKGGNGKIFAVGDCCDLLPNAGAQVMSNIRTLGKNLSLTLKAFESGTPSSLEDLSLKKHVKSPQLYVATVGGEDGVVATPLFHTQFILPSMKNKTMFYFKVWSDIGIKE